MSKTLLDGDVVAKLTFPGGRTRIVRGLNIDERGKSARRRKALIADETRKLLRNQQAPKGTTVVFFNADAVDCP